MNIKSWEIWYTFSTYYLDEFSDLLPIAERLVSNEFSYFAIHRDGDAFWKSKKGYQKGKFNVELDEDNKHATYELKPIKGNMDIDSFSLELSTIAFSFRFSELKLLGSDSYLPPPYIRAYLSPIRLQREDFGEVDLYPIITIY